MITIQNADAALKDYYLDAVSAQLNEGISPFFTAVEKNADSVYGKDVKLAVVRGFAGNVMAGAEDGDLPDPHKNRYVNITAPLKNIYGTIEISDKAIRASMHDEAAFVNLLNAEMEGLLKASKHNLGRMLYGDGSGILAHCGARHLQRQHRCARRRARLPARNVRVNIQRLGRSLLGDGLRPA